MARTFPHTRVGAKLASTWLDFQDAPVIVPTSRSLTRHMNMINALVAPQAVRAPLALRKSAKTGSKTRAAAVAPKIVTASSNAPRLASPVASSIVYALALQ